MTKAFGEKTYVKVVAITSDANARSELYTIIKDRADVVDKDGKVD